MMLLRAMLALLIAIGLVLSPIAAAMPAKAQAASHAMAMTDCPSHGKSKPAAHADHSCCDPTGLMARCAAALCGLKCFKVAAVLALPIDRDISGPRQRVVPSLLDETASLSWRPPIPPPRA